MRKGKDMKKGISYWAYSGKTYRQAFGYAKQKGFDGVEVTLDSEGEITMKTTDEQVLKIKEQAEEADIALYSVATGLYWNCPLTSNDLKMRRQAKDIVRRQLEIASLLKCDSILVVPALVDENTAYDIAYDRAFDAICELAPYAEDCGVAIGLENVWNKFFLSPLEYRDFIDKIGSPYVKAYFDVGNVVYDGYPEQWIRILGSRICKIHIKDYVRENRTLAGFVDIGMGDIDFKKVFSALEQVGYNDFCTAEVSPAGQENYEAVDKAAAAYGRIFK